MFDRVFFKKVKPIEMRYDTIRDWIIDVEDDASVTLILLFVDLVDPRYNYLLCQHELIEAQICRFQDVTSKEVDDFDVMFERERDPFDYTNEPGDDPRAPYHMAHVTAETVERVIALRLGVVWGCYMDACKEAFIKVRSARALHADLIAKGHIK